MSDATKRILVRLTPEQHKRVKERANRWIARSRNYRTENDYVLMRLLGEEHEPKEKPVSNGGTGHHTQGV